MKREHLIPSEKEQRGRNKRITLSAFLGVLSVLCLLYCLCIALFMGYGSSFFLIWAVLAGFLGCLSWLLAHKKIMEFLPRWIKGVFCLLVAIGLLLFTIIEGMILSEFGAQAEPGADYVIVLGAQWKTNGPSYVLQKRLDKSVEYLKENPMTRVIVSGGQGSNEPISEALGMQGYLLEAGIAAERIIMEDKSTNTCENLVFSSEFLDEEKDRVVLVTNNFHVFRATAIAGKKGYAEVEGLAAASYPGMLPNNLLREFFGVIKDYLVGNM